MTMIERVAAAIYEKSRSNAWLDSLNMDEAVIFATVAVASMREPTEGMVFDGLRVPVQFDANTTMIDGKAMWKAMIDAALEGKVGAPRPEGTSK